MTRYLVFAAAFCILAAVTPTPADHSKSQRVNRMSQGWPIDDFTLVDQHGKAFTREQLERRWTFVLLGDTRCAEPCRAALSALAGMCRRIARTGAMKTTQVLFVSLNPEQDSPASLQEYLTPFDNRFIGATGSRQTLKRLVDDLGAPAPVPMAPETADASNDHYRGSLLLIDPDGTVRGEFLPPFDVLLLTSEYLKTRVRR